MHKFRTLGAFALASAAALVASPAFAVTTPPDYSSLTSAVDFSTTQTAIMSIGALVVTLTLVIVGIRKIVRMVRGA